jgi:hypothetical protein
MSNLLHKLPSEVFQKFLSISSPRRLALERDTSKASQ